MFKVFLIIAGILLLLAAGFLIRLKFLAVKSQDPAVFPLRHENESGLSDCPKTPNCHRIEIDNTDITQPPEQIGLMMLTLREVISTMGGEIVSDDSSYIHAVFKSKIFGFVDDLEVLIKDKQLQIRSASRAGYSDFGVNQKRVEELLERLKLPGN